MFSSDSEEPASMEFANKLGAERFEMFQVVQYGLNSCYYFRKQIQSMRKGPRQKLFAVCGKDWKTIYQIKWKEGAEWVFDCKQYLLEVKKRNLQYKYGNTWKR